MAQAGISMECGYCLRKGSALEEPKVLPCSHAHCLKCLTVYFNLHHIVKCPTCSEVHDVKLDGFSAKQQDDSGLRCDICLEHNVEDRAAVIYCTFCSKKYCAQHRVHHEALFKKHTGIEITEFSAKKKIEVRKCTKHALQLTLGCETCLDVICAHCVPGLATHTDGSLHKLKPMDELVSVLTEEINALKLEVIKKEEKLEGLSKKTQVIITEYDTETEEMVKNIHQRRDEQTDAIKRKYEQLEKELVELRANCKETMTRFMADDVETELCELSKHRVQTETKIKHSHQVDIVTEFKNLKAGMQTLLEAEIPDLELRKMSKLDRKDDSRGIELDIISVEGYISWEKGLTSSKPTPKSLKQQQTVKLSAQPSSICNFQGNTYIGLHNRTVCKLGSTYRLTNAFMTLGNYVESVTVYKDRLYTLVYGTPFTIYVHDLAGRHITSWNHTDGNSHFNKLIIIGDKIIIPDRQNKWLTFYSLTGQILKHLPCPQLTTGYTATCAADSDSIIVSLYSSNQVFRMNLSTGKVIWSSTHVSTPEGVVCYGSRWVLVASNSSDKIRILDLSTGDFLFEMTASGIAGNSNVFDLDISCNSLIIPQHSTSQVLFYQME